MISYQSISLTPFMENCRIFVNTENQEALICDPGDSGEELFHAISEKGYTLKSIIITHMHLDHVGGVYELARLSSAKIYGSAIEDLPLLEGLNQQAVAFRLPQTEQFKTSWLKDGEIITPIKDFSLRVIATPGHTPGGICYYSEEHRLLLTGDTIFQNSVGRTDFPLGSAEQLLDSIRSKLLILPHDTAILPGHGPDSTIGDEIQLNPYL